MPGNAASLVAFINRLPKAELHLHLEGSARPDTLRELARRKRRLRKETEEWIRQRTQQNFRYRDFPDFLSAFKLVTLLLESPEDYALVTTRLVEWLAAQNVRYAEVTLAAGVVLWKQQALEAIFEACSTAARAAETRWGVRLRWIFDVIRHYGPEPARPVLEAAIRFRGHGVVAFGIGGDEVRGPVQQFAEIAREAREHGLHVVAHAGETVGPESIRQAVETVGAERIGHGLTAARDAGVLALLRERRIPLEVCPTSNVATGLLLNLGEHPLPRFLDAGLEVTLNSDDPAMFGTSLEREYVAAAEQFALSRERILRLCASSFRAAFLPEEEKRTYLKTLAEAAAGI
jgi:adenosine deaminase/aminodeoxyfutalosine deaminase